MVDNVDMQIVEHLSDNSRMPYMQIANRLKLSESAVRKRVRSLEIKGVIQKYSLVVDHSKIGYNNVALVGIDVDPEKYIDVAKKLKIIPSVKFVASTIGDHMFMLEVVARDNEHLTEVCEELKLIHGVRRICPAVIKDTIKGSL